MANPEPSPQNSNSRIGVLGGTFDPPHIGHMIIAQEAMTQLNLAQVIFAPTRKPPHKLGNEITPIDHRLKMVELALNSNPRFVLSRVDVDRTGPTYTVDTLRLLRRDLGESVDLYFIMGLDSLANILTWHTPDKLIELCRLAVFNRPGYAADLDALNAQIPGLRERVILLKSPALEIAASDLQQRVRAGQSIKHLVPDRVAAYIAEHRLYRK